MPHDRNSRTTGLRWLLERAVLVVDVCTDAQLFTTPLLQYPPTVSVGVGTNMQQPIFVFLSSLPLFSLRRSQPLPSPNQNPYAARPGPDTQQRLPINLLDQRSWAVGDFPVARSKH